MLQNLKLAYAMKIAELSSLMEVAELEMLVANLNVIQLQLVAGSVRL